MISTTEEEAPLSASSTAEVGAKGYSNLKSSCSGRVRDLAKRFEQPTTNVHIRTLNSFSKNSRRRFYKTNDKGER